jgi:hypothetical protein
LIIKFLKKSWHLFDDFQAHGALSGDDMRMIVSVYVRQSLGFGDAHGVLARLANVAAVNDDFGAKLTARLDFHDGRDDGHHHGDRDAQLLAVIRQAQCVITGRCGDYTCFLKKGHRVWQKINGSRVNLKRRKRRPCGNFDEVAK